MKWLEESIESALKDANPLTKLMIKDAYNDRRKIFYTIVVMLLLMILSSAFTSKLFCYMKLDVLMLQLETNHNLAIALLIIYAVFVVYKVVYVRVFVKDLLPTVSSFFRLVALLLLYFYFLKFQFEPFAHFRIAFLYGADIIILLSSILLLDFKPYKKLPLQIVGQGFYNDSFDIKSDKDTLSREHIASEIANVINETYPMKSFAIGVIGEWGYGKTTFVEFIFKRLRELHGESKNVIIKFHPWKPHDKPEITREFYSQLISEVEKFDSKLSRSIALYADRLVGGGSENVGIIKSVIANISGNNNSIEYYFKAVEEAIESSGRKFIIYIDDLDRLSGEEILEVLKIIRGTAELPNFFFISGFDISYVKDVLVKSNSIAHEHGFLRKIFQLEFILPPITENNIIVRVEDIVNNDIVLSVHSETILDTFNNLFDESVAKAFNRANGEPYNYGEVVIRTYRDVIRVLNSLKVSIKLIGGHVVIKDLVIVEVIKNLYPEVYLELAISKRLFKIVTNSGLDERSNVSVDIERVKQAVSRINGANKVYDENLIVNLLNGTSLDSQLKGQQGRYRLSQENNHIIYFNYLVQHIPSEHEFKIFWNATLEDRIEIIKTKFDSKQILYINEVISKERNPESFEDFKKQIYTLLYYSSLSDSLNRYQILDLLNKYIPNRKASVKIELIEQMFEEVTFDNRISILIRSLFNHEILYNLIKGDSLLFPHFDHGPIIPKLKQRAYSLLEEYLTSINSINHRTFRMYYNNLETIKDNRIILTEAANKLFLEVVDKYKRDYIALLLRPVYTPPDNYYTFEPFIPQTFEEEKYKPYAKFEQFLNDALKNGELSDLKFILDIFSRFKSSGFDRVELSSSEISQVNKIQEPYSITH
jgi:hypothetical protein